MLRFFAIGSSRDGSDLVVPYCMMLQVPGSLSTTQIFASVAYHQMVGYSSLLSIGFNTGWVNKQINSADLKFPDQFDGKFFDTNVPTMVIIDQPNINYFDMQVGLNYAYFPNAKTYLNAGFSVQHINGPQETFFNTEPVGYSDRIPPRFIGFLNGSFKTSDHGDSESYGVTIPCRQVQVNW